MMFSCHSLSVVLARIWTLKTKFMLVIGLLPWSRVIVLLTNKNRAWRCSEVGDGVDSSLTLFDHFQPSYNTLQLQHSTDHHQFQLTPPNILIMVQEWVPNGFVSVCGFWLGKPCGNTRESIHYDRLEQSRHYNDYHTKAERARYRTEIQDVPVDQVRAWLATIDPTIFTDWEKKKAKCLETCAKNRREKERKAAEVAVSQAAAAAAAAQVNNGAQQTTRRGRAVKRVKYTK